MEEKEKEKETCPDEFALAITRIAVAQICRWVGLRGAQQSALEGLTDVSAKYLRALGQFAVASTMSCARTEANLFDIIRALEDVNAVQGFPGASDVNRPLLASQTLVDLAKFVECCPEIPFAKPIPRCLSPSKESESVCSINATISKKFLRHIPGWLPAIPDNTVREINGKEAPKEKGENSSDNSNSSSSSSIRIGGCVMVGTELPEKRSKVKFKMVGAGKKEATKCKSEEFGVDSRNGVCRGGKRVFCQNLGDDKIIQNKVCKKRIVEKPR
ncbi:hypothetical protein NMG60_11036518 [Bertholletia excelsa]